MASRPQPPGCGTVVRPAEPHGQAVLSDPVRAQLSAGPLGTGLSGELRFRPGSARLGALAPPCGGACIPAPGSVPGFEPSLFLDPLGSLGTPSQNNAYKAYQETLTG